MQKKLNIADKIILIVLISIISVATLSIVVVLSSAGVEKRKAEARLEELYPLGTEVESKFFTARMVVVGYQIKDSIQVRVFIPGTRDSFVTILKTNILSEIEIDGSAEVE